MSHLCRVLVLFLAIRELKLGLFKPSGPTPKLHHTMSTNPVDLGCDHIVVALLRVLRKKMDSDQRSIPLILELRGAGAMMCGRYVRTDDVNTSFAFGVTPKGQKNRNEHQQPQNGLICMYWYCPPAPTPAMMRVTVGLTKKCYLAFCV